MEAKYGFLLAVLVICLSGCHGDQSLTTSIDNSRPNIGDTVIMECKITNFEAGKTTVKWQKIVQTENPEDEIIWDLSTNNELEDSATAVGRYAIVPAIEDPNVFLNLHINGVEHEDSGTYRCINQGATPNEEDSVEMHTMVHPSVVSLTIDGVEYEDGAELNFTGGEASHVKCEVGKGYPHPQALVRIGEQDKTEDFLLQEQREVERIGETHLFKIWHNRVRESRDFKVQYSDKGKRLACVGKLEGSDEEISTGIIIDMGGSAPLLDCERKSAYEYEPKVNIKCTVQGFGGDLEAWVVYREQHEHGENITLKAGEKKYHYSLKFDKDSENADAMTLQLEMDRVFPQMFRTYKFVVKNTVGVASQEVQLDSVPSPHAVKGSSPALLVNSLVTLLCAALCWIHSL